MSKVSLDVNINDAEPSGILPFVMALEITDVRACVLCCAQLPDRMYTSYLSSTASRPDRTSSFRFVSSLRYRSLFSPGGGEYEVVIMNPKPNLADPPHTQTYGMFRSVSMRAYTPKPKTSQLDYVPLLSLLFVSRCNLRE